RIGPQGSPAGAVVGLVPASEPARLFAAAPHAPDAAIMLLRSNGAMLVAHPTPPAGAAATEGELLALFDDKSVTMVRHVTASDGSWRIEALQALDGYPAAVAVSRSADRALAGWLRQSLWF